jgi:tetratricopeptide (TPR) repeat protein
MANKSKITAPTQAEQNVGEILSKTDQFVEAHLKLIISVIVAIILLVVAIIVIRHEYFIPKEKEAQNAIFPGENYISTQQWDLALNGDSLGYSGFLGVIEDYGFTQTGNLAQAYAGICYYHLGDYESALQYLKKYKGKDRVIASSVIAMIGNSYADTGEPDKAITYFKDAANKANSASLSPVYLKKAAVAYEKIENYKGALDIYNTIKTKYPESQEATNIDKYIEKAKSLIK